MRRNRSVRRFVKRNRDKLWVTIVFDNHDVPTGLTPDATTLIAPEDWEESAQTEFHRGATVMGIRGNMVVSIDPVEWTANRPTSYGMTIFKTSVAALSASMDPLDPANYGTNDVLNSRVGMVYGHLNGDTLEYDFLVNDHFDLDVKAKRKLDSSEQLLMNFRCDDLDETDTGVMVSGIVRVLLHT